MFKSKCLYRLGVKGQVTNVEVNGLMSEVRGQRSLLRSPLNDHGSMGNMWRVKGERLSVRESKVEGYRLCDKGEG